MLFDTASISHQGGRPENQDCLSEIHMDGGTSSCWVLADGLGGHAGGQIASTEAVQSILLDFVSDRSTCEDPGLCKWVEHAHLRLVSIQTEEEQLAQMRTTIVVLQVRAGVAYWTHCGDSRFYWFSEGRISIQSEDHSIPQALVKLGQLLPEDIRSHEDRNRITQCLGSPGGVTASDNPPIPLTPDAAFILCSDGFWEHVLEPEMLIDLAKAKDAQHWLDLMLTRCESRAVAECDNYSAIVGMISAGNLHG